MSKYRLSVIQRLLRRRSGVVITEVIMIRTDEIHALEMHTHDVHAYDVHANEAHIHKVHVGEICAMGYTLMKYTPMKYMLIRYMLMRVHAVRYAPMICTLIRYKVMRNCQTEEDAELLVLSVWIVRCTHPYAFQLPGTLIHRNQASICSCDSSVGTCRHL